MREEQLTLGDLRVSPSRLTISSRQEATVQPLVMDVLTALADSCEVVPRAALEARVWNGAHVGYHSLPRAISQARRAIADAGSAARIEAVPKRGYRLIPAMPATPNAPQQPDASQGPERRPLRAARIVSAAAFVAAIGLAMHAAGLHGSPWHLASLSILAAGAGVSGWFTAV